MKKKLLVLANSIKGRDHRCVAGIEVTSSGLDSPTFGKWVRPIDENEREGAILESTSCISYSQVSHLDVIEIDFSRHANDANHQEDWVINKEVPWRLEGKLDASVFSKLSIGNYDRWGGETGISPGQFPTSLQLLRLQANMRVTGSFEEWDGELSFKRKAHFDDYSCGVTDPNFSRKYNLFAKHVGRHETKTINVNAGSYIVLSLTPPFGAKNLQYRVVASIFET